MKSIDVAAYIWPSYHYEPRCEQFWPEKDGEWYTVRKATPRFEGHDQPRIPLLGSKDFGAVDGNNATTNFTFTVSNGSPLIGQQLQLKFSNTGTGYQNFDNITGDLAAVAPATPGTLSYGK